MAGKSCDDRKTLLTSEVVDSWYERLLNSGISHLVCVGDADGMDQDWCV